MEWNRIITEIDIKHLMDTFGYFHDGCVKEIKYISGSYVDNNLSMHPLNTRRETHIIFQRQFRNPSVIEMVFEKTIKLNLVPCSDVMYDCSIFDASLVLKDNIFYWGEWEDLDVDKLEREERTWISAEKVKWRVLENCLDDREIYVTQE